MLHLLPISFAHHLCHSLFSPCSSSVRVFDDREDVTHPPSLVTTGAMPFIINHREPCHWSQRLHRRSGSCTRDLLSPWRRGEHATGARPPRSGRTRDLLSPWRRGVRAGAAILTPPHASTPPSTTTEPLQPRILNRGVTLDGAHAVKV
ncbi:hypothetical protein Bca52824_039603 [Brassica carinata]|uniref:Uncharacterized protein n=1 Tax=Brassica carinata TaxID=52824 RepID=A0A8X7UW45_BRACI|nr:hypothetical protein Bca52824_039603 [Brassica carinata]